MNDRVSICRTADNPRGMFADGVRVRAGSQAETLGHRSEWAKAYVFPDHLRYNRLIPASMLQEARQDESNLE